MEEIWKPVLGHEDSYEASNLGRVRSLDRWKEYDQTHTNGYSDVRIVHVRRHFKGQILKPYKHGPRKERWGIDLAIAGGIGEDQGARVKCQLTRVIWEAFNGSIPDEHWIHHKNRDWGDCALSNLECLPLSNVLDKRIIPWKKT